MFVVSLLLVGIVAALGGAGGWWLWRARVGPADQPRQVWRIAPAPYDFFAAPEPVTVGVARLVAGFGGVGGSASVGGPASGGDEEPLRVHQHELGAALPALLTGHVGATYASIPSVYASRVPTAAVGAGVMAWPVRESADDGGAGAGEVGAGKPGAGAAPSVRSDVPALTVHGGDAPGPTFRALPAPGWLLGLSAAGDPVQVQLVPGSTVLLHGGGSAEWLLERLPADLPWVRVLRPETLGRPALVGSEFNQTGAGSTTPADLGDAWRDTWSPTVCRVVLTESIEEATRHGIIADLTIDSRGSVSHRGKRVAFDPMHLPHRQGASLR